MTESMEALRARASAGEPGALTAIGKRLLFGDGVQPSPREGIAHLRDAANRGDGEAAALLARLAAWGVLQHRDAARAIDLLQRSAELGWRPAQDELRFLARAEGSDWAALRKSVDVGGWLKAPAPRQVLERPRIRIFDGFAAPNECDWIIAHLRGDLERAKVYRGSPEARITDTRTNSEASLMVKSSDVAVCFMRDRIASALRIAPEFCEVARLLHYTVGQKFSLHSDFMEPKTPALREEIERRGQRVATFLLYLNDDYESGETDFPKAGFRFKGRKGDALLFINVDESGAPDYLSMHAGLPPTSGEKWVLSQWIGSKSINAYMTPGPTPAPLGLAWLRSV